MSIEDFLEYRPSAVLMDGEVAKVDVRLIKRNNGYFTLTIGYAIGQLTDEERDRAIRLQEELRSFLRNRAKTAKPEANNE